MTVIYVDRIFFLNIALDYLLLLSAARLAGIPLRRVRLLLCAAAGGLYASAVFCPIAGGWLILRQSCCPVHWRAWYWHWAWQAAHRMCFSAAYIMPTLAGLCCCCRRSDFICCCTWYFGKVHGMGEENLWM